MSHKQEERNDLSQQGVGIQDDNQIPLYEAAQRRLPVATEIARAKASTSGRQGARRDLGDGDGDDDLTTVEVSARKKAGTQFLKSGLASHPRAVQWKGGQGVCRLMVVHVNNAIAGTACRSCRINFADLLLLRARSGRLHGSPNTQRTHMEKKDRPAPISVHLLDGTRCWLRGCYLDS